MQHSGVMMDQQKRVFYYGLNPEVARIRNENDMNDLFRTPATVEMQTFVNKSPDHAALLHGVVGLCTELGELVDALFKCIHDVNTYGEIQPATLKNLYEECGDNLWYVDVILAFLGKSIPQCALSNADKLLTRYNERMFKAHQAEVRDLDSEKAALEKRG